MAISLFALVPWRFTDAATHATEVPLSERVAIET
jgi:hypothetical protein